MTTLWESEIWVVTFWFWNCHQISTSAAFGLFTEHSKEALLSRMAVSCFGLATVFSEYPVMKNYRCLLSIIKNSQSSTNAFLFFIKIYHT